MEHNSTQNYASYYVKHQYSPQNWFPPIPWQAWPPQQVQNQPWKQGWLWITYGNMLALPYSSKQYQYLPQIQQQQYPP